MKHVSSSSEAESFCLPWLKTMGKLRLSYVAILLPLAFHSLAAFICDVNSYGKPESSDCHTLFDKVTKDATSQARFFDEEQL